MIIQEIMYGVKCDRCGDIHESCGYTLFSCEDEALEESEENDWIEEGGKHYCTGCYTIDEESGECKPKPEYPKHVKKFKKVLEVLTGRRVDLKDNKDCFELSGYASGGLCSYEKIAIEALLGDNNVEFIVHQSIWGISHEIKVKIKK